VRRRLSINGCRLASETTQLLNGYPVKFTSEAVSVDEQSTVRIHFTIVKLNVRVNPYRVVYGFTPISDMT